MKTLLTLLLPLAAATLLSSCASSSDTPQGANTVSVQTDSDVASERKRRSQPSYVYNTETRQYEWVNDDLPATSPYQQ